MPQAASVLTVERVLSGIHYFRCHDYLELVALVNILPEFVAEHPKVRQTESTAVFLSCSRC